MLLGRGTSCTLAQRVLGCSHGSKFHRLKPLPWYKVLKHQSLSSDVSNGSQLFRAVQTGDEDAVKRLAPKEENINATDRKGWTPLMMACYSGHDSITQILLKHGANPHLKNFTGQTSIELALLGSHMSVASFIDKHLSKPDKMEVRQFFDHNPLIRHSEKRNDDIWLLSCLQKLPCRFILLHRLRPVAIKGSRGGSHDSVRLRVFSVIEIHQLITNERQNLIFLGVDPVSDSNVLDTESGIPWFALDVGHLEEKEVTKLDEEAFLLNPYPGALQMTDTEAALFAQARGLCDWHSRHMFCPSCGSKTTLTTSGYKRICQDPICLSNTGIFNTSYPRVDPTVIAAVVSRDGEHCILARKPSFAPGMFTCLAGYVEPGESLEATCRREVHEEVGMNVESVTYVASQPWPMPSSLMLGCLAVVQETATCSIKLDEDELEEGRWFSRKEATQMLLRSHPQRLFVPPPQAIANTLVKTWLLQTAAGIKDV